MRVKKSKGQFLSSNGEHTIQFYTYTPENIAPRGVLQISHGMCEYLERYEELAVFLASRGYIVTGNDHLGHGKLAQEADTLGFFHKVNGYQYLVKDMYKLKRTIESTYGNLPYYVFGHSMGSFITRLFVSRYGKELAGAIICGTSGNNPFTTAAKGIAKSLKAQHGEHYVSQKLKRMAFGSYNSTYVRPRTEYDWISRKEDVVDKYIEDPLCQFDFTVSAYLDMFTMLERANSEEIMKKTPNKLPLFVISGDDDPVGNYGKGIVDLVEELMQAGQQDLSVRLYPGARHELVNEINKEEVFRDILYWLGSKRQRSISEK